MKRLEAWLLRHWLPVMGVMTAWNLWDAVQTDGTWSWVFFGFFGNEFITELVKEIRFRRVMWRLRDRIS